MDSIIVKDGTKAKTVPISDVLAQVTHSKEDIVVLCGTLITGYGNSNSDFDVHVFCETLPVVESHHFDTNDWICNDKGKWLDRATLKPGQRMKGLWNFWDEHKKAVDVKYWLIDEYQDFLHTFKQRYVEATQELGYLRSPAYGLYGIGDNTALSKIFDGVCVKGQDRFAQFDSIFTREEYCYLAYRLHLPTYDEFRDVAGAFLSEDYENAVSFSRKYIELTAWSFSHLLGNPNTNRKWVFEMSKRWPAPYQTLSARFVELFFRGLPGDAEKRGFVLDVMELADEIFAAAIDLQRQTPAFDRVDEAFAFWHSKLGQSPAEATRSEQLKLEFDWYARNFTKDVVGAEALMKMHQ